MRKLNEESINLIKKYEGLRLKPYLDSVGVPTIGYGTTVYPNGTKVAIKDPDITVEDANSFFEHDVAKFAAAVEKYVTVPLNDNEFGALVAFTYNVGISAFSNSTLLKKLNSGDRLGAADQLDRWVYAKGQKLKGLVRRREVEKTLFLKPLN